MKTRYQIAVVVVLLAVVGVTFAQLKRQEGPQPGGPVMLPAPIPHPSDYSVPAPQHRVVASKPEDMTIEQLIDAVEKFREQKSEIEKKEKAYMKVLQMKADKLRQKVDSLNGGVEGPPPIVNTTGPVILPVPSSMIPEVFPIPALTGTTIP